MSLDREKLKRRWNELWNERGVDWGRVAYNKTTVGVVEKLASRLRTVDERLSLALKIVAPAVAGKIVLDLGCGNGILCFKLLDMGAKKVIGIDFSQNVIKKANLKAEEHGVADRCEFICGDVVNTPLPEADITTGLGLLDYLNRKEVENLFRNLNSPLFLFCFLPCGYSPLSLLHRIYLKYRGWLCYRYTQEELRNMLADAGYKHIFFPVGGLVHNFSNIDCGRILRTQGFIFRLYNQWL